MSVAPMMDYTDRHQRYLHRLISRQSVVYTEMVTANAILRTSDLDRQLLANIPFEDPIVLQLGGSDPAMMHDAAKSAMKYGYKDININVVSY